MLKALLAAAGIAAVSLADPGQYAREGPAPQLGPGPDSRLPRHLRRLTEFGERADFSHDGRRILFLNRTFGDAYEVEIATGKIRPVTHHYPHAGYTRALYLSNGDILLSGCPVFDPKNPGHSRVHSELYILDKSLAKPPVPLNTKCSEGPAVSRKRLHIAWTHVAEQYPDSMPAGSSRIQEADIVYDGGIPRLSNRRPILDSRDLPFKCTLETQNFRPPQERELTFSAYNHQGTEACGIDLQTKKVVNYSNALDQYDEPEGIFPDGRHTCIECDRQNGMDRKGSQYIDIWKLALDGSGRLERLTEFNRFPGYKASNPVISDDGRFMAFQMARLGDPAGYGRGLFLYDFTKRKP